MYKPTRPKNIDAQISVFTNNNLPHFFKYAKDKEEHQVFPVNNSFVNKLENIIPNPRINFRKLEVNPIDYTLLMRNPDIECIVNFTDKGKLIKESTDPLIVKYYELSNKYKFALNNASQVDKCYSADVLKNSQLKQELRYKRIVEEIQTELSKFGYSNSEVADILVKLLYVVKDSKHKMILWLCYGDYIYENLSGNLKLHTKDVQCVDCGEWFTTNVKDNKVHRCEACAIEHKREMTRLRVQRYRQNQL